MPRLYPPGIKKLLRVLRVDWIGNENRFKDLADYKDYLNRGALHFAAEAGLTDACQYLVEELKLDINAKDTHGITPLVSASMEGHTTTAKYLVERGASLQVELGLTALHHAAENGDFELMEFLLGKGVSVDLKGASLYTPIASAAHMSREDVVKFLLEHGADPNGQPEDYTTPLQKAISADSFACSKLLIQEGADANFVAHGYYPLHLAANGGNVEIINLLLEAGAKPDIMSDVLFTDDMDDLWPRKPIEVAAARGHKEAVKVLFPVTKPIDFKELYSGVAKKDNIKEWSVDGLLGSPQPENGKKEKGKKTGRAKISGVK
ncbi:hypothetical protein OROMI_023639 [Orobanche minor]